MTREMLDDLLVDVPRHVVPDVDAAWRTGTARRRRGHAVSATTVVVVALVAGLAVLGFDRVAVDPADGSGGVQGHPREVPRPVVLTDLPDAPGPMAGVLELASATEWAVVDDAGRTWRLPGVSRWDSYPPALSNDGRMLGYLRTVSEDRSEYVVVDLVTGRRTAFPEVGDGRSYDDEMLTTQRYFDTAQSPNLWSPDNRWLTVFGGALENANNGPLLVGIDGGVRELGVGDWPVGWLAPDRLAMLNREGDLMVVDLDGRVLERVTLDVPDGFELFGQWSGTLSPDGSMVAVAADEATDRDPGHRISTYDTRTGRLLDTLPWRGSTSSGCLLAWKDDRVLAWDYGGGLVDLASGELVVEPSSQWGELSCGTFAADALGGPAQHGPGLAEWRYWSWLWWWKQILVGLVVGAAVLWLYLRRRRLD